MKRREFFKASALAGAGLTVLSTGCENSGKKSDSPLIPAENSFPLEEMTIADLQQKMERGDLTARGIVELYLQRIEEIDRNGPKLNSIIELNPDALTIADALDVERKQEKVRGLLHGIPVLIKDNIDTADKMMTTAGALALEGNIASRDAFIAVKLREAGAIILGKTNPSEWANFRSTRSTSGWSSRGGQTKNPYYLDRNPCGSSSGTGSAISANLGLIGIGTETNGSIACPSAINGIVGIKPTVGLWSRAGIIPISQTQDTAGPMTRTVTDAAILLGALTGEGPLDGFTAGSSTKAKKDYTPFLKTDGLKGKRIGVEKSLLKGHEAIDALFKNAIQAMKSQGATVIEVDLLGSIKDLDDEEFTVLKYEFKDGVNRYLEGANAKVKSLKEVIAFNRANEARAMPFFKQEILESAEKLGGLDSKEYKSSLEELHRVTRGAINTLMKEQRLDVICAPAAGPSWCTDLVNGDAFTGYEFSGPSAVAGYPSITVPMGMVSGLPIGLLFFAGPFAEPELISIAFSYEQATHHRKPPRFLTSITG